MTLIYNLSILLILLSVFNIVPCFCCEQRVLITDGANRKVNICTSSNLIVLITTQEILRVLGVHQRVVAVHRWVKALHPDENPIMAQKPIIGGFGKGDVNYEKIVEIACRTRGEDLVITYESPWAEDVELQLDRLEGIKVLKLRSHNMEEFDSQYSLLAKAVGKELEWHIFQDWRNAVLHLVQNRLKRIMKDERPYVYWDASAGGHYDTVNRQSAVSQMIQMAGGNNICEDLSLEHGHISPEMILTYDPEFVISHDNNMFHLIGKRLGYNEHDSCTRAQALFKLSQTVGIKGTKAERDHKIYFIQDDLISGPKQAIGVMWLAKWFYPKIFTDIQPERYHKEFYERFMRITYKGIHVYPKSQGSGHDDSK